MKTKTAELKQPENSYGLANEEVMLIGAVAAARLCGVSLTTWRKLVAEGKAPAPIRLGRRVLWNKSELKQWVNAGCPVRDQWLWKRSG